MKNIYDLLEFRRNKLDTHFSFSPHRKTKKEKEKGTKKKITNRNKNLRLRVITPT